jgi:hypothetical protein
VPLSASDIDLRDQHLFVASGIGLFEALAGGPAAMPIR